MAQTDLINEGLLADYHDELMKDHIVGGTVFDISSYHATGTPPVLAEYANLAAALGTNGGNVPESMRKGGMSVKFVSSIDHKYVQYRLMSTAWSTDLNNWLNIEDTLAQIESNINVTIDTDTFVTGIWQGQGQDIFPNSSGSYSNMSRNEKPYKVLGKTNAILTLYNERLQKLKINDLGPTIKFTDEDGNSVGWSWNNGGWGIKLSGDARYMYIHILTSDLSKINHTYFLGFVTVNENIGKMLDDIKQNSNIINKLNRNVSYDEKNLYGGTLDFLMGYACGIYPNHAYIGNSLGNNPSDNSDNSAFGKIDVSSVEDGTNIYLLKDGVNVFAGVTFKFFGTDGNIISASNGGSYETNDRGKQKPSGAVILGIHIANNYITGDITEYLSGIVINMPVTFNNLKEQIFENTLDITALKNQDIPNKIAKLSSTIGYDEKNLYGGTLDFLMGYACGIYPNHAYIGNSLGNNPSDNSDNSAFGKIDVSSVEDGTNIYLLKDGVNVFAGVTFKFFGTDGNIISASNGGSYETNDRGKQKPSGAVILGIHIANNYITGDITEYLSGIVINMPVTFNNLKEQIFENTLDITALKSQEDYRAIPKILMIGSSFSYDTIYEVGNICSSYGKKIVLGSAEIGGGTLGAFIDRYNSHTGITYRKWNKNATQWVGYGDIYLENILSDEAWDFVILQNGAYQSPHVDQSSFWIKTDGVITRNIVQELIDLCKKLCLYSNPVFGMNMTWAFSVYHTIASNHLNDDYWESYGNNQKNRQLGMWNNNVTNYMDCVSNCVDVKFIIPTGTAIQNARANDSLRQTTIYTSASPAPPTISEAESITSLNGIEQTYPFMDNVVNWRNKTDFTRDSIHADYGIGRYIAASTLFQKVLSKVLGLDIQDCTYRIPQEEAGDHREQLCTAVTNDNISAIVDCVKSAILNPTSIQS